MSEKVALVLEINGVPKNIASLKELKQAIKDSRNELLKYDVGTEGFAKAQKNISELTDKVKDLGNSAKIQGTGVERLSASFGLLGEAFTSGDLDKGKLALTGIGQAMSAIPIFLLIEGLKLLVDNFDEVVKFARSLTGYVNENEVAIKRLTQQIEEQKGQTELLKATIEGEIAILTAQGASVDVILKKKKELLEVQVREIEQSIVLNKLKLQEAKNTATTGDIIQGVINQTLFMMGLQETAFKRNSEQAEERKQRQVEIENQIKASEAAIYELKNKYTVEEITANKAKADARKKAQADYEAEQKRINDALAKQSEELAASDLENEQAFYDSEQAKIKATEDRAKEQKRIEDELNAAIFMGRINQAAIDDRLNAEKLAKEKLLAEQIANAEYNARKQGLLAAQNLSQAYFNYELSKAKGDAAAQDAIKKKAFDIDKAFNIAKATMDGYRAVLSAYASTPGGPLLKGVAAGVAAAFAASQVALIASTQYNGGASTTQSSPSAVPSIATGNGGQVPNIATRPQSGTLLNEEGQQISQVERDREVIKAYVVAKELTNKQKNNKRIKEQSKF